MEQHLGFYEAAEGWEQTLDGLRPDYLWLPSEIPVFAKLEAHGWRKLFSTDRSAVFGAIGAPAPLPVLPAAAQLADCFPG